MRKKTKARAPLRANSRPAIAHAEEDSDYISAMCGSASNRGFAEVPPAYQVLDAIRTEAVHLPLSEIERYQDYAGGFRA